MNWLENLFKEAGFSARMLRKNLGFTLVAVLTLTLGIGVNLALFAHFNEQFLRPLPVAKPQELWAILPACDSPQEQFYNWSRYYYQAIRHRHGAFGRVAGYAQDQANYQTRDGWEELDIWLVSGDYFDFLGVRPLLGRALVQDDEKIGAAPVAVISHRFWRKEFDLRPDVVGKPLKLNSTVVEVVGVMPEGFDGMQTYGRPRDLWLPASLDDSFNYLQPRYQLVGRLGPGTDPKQAADSLAPVVQDVTEILTREKTAGDSNHVPGFSRVALKRAGRGDVPPEWITQETYRTFGLVGLGTTLVLLIAMLNLASLALARVLRRRKETATRMALGAARAAVVRQIVVEALILSGLGTLGGWLTLSSIGRVLPVLVPTLLRRPMNLEVDVRMVIAASGLAFLVGVFFSLLPAWHATRLDPLEALKEPEGHAGLVERRWPWSRVLVVLQLAGLFALLCGAVLCISIIRWLTHTCLGFDTDRVVLATADLWKAGFSGRDATLKAEELRQRLARLPGVETVGLLASRPFDTFAGTMASDKPDWIPGYTPPDGAPIESGFVWVGPGVFRSLGVPIVAGRDMEDADFSRHRFVALVNESFVRKFWPNRVSLGKEITIYRVENYQIVGILADARLEHLALPPRPTIYFSAGDRASSTPTFVIKANGNTQSLFRPIRALLQGEHLRLSPNSVGSLREAMGYSLYRERAVLSVLGWLSFIALGLTFLGVFGTVSYSVSQRGREYGIRLAIGARPRDVGFQVLRSGMATAFAGIILGVPLAIWAAAMLRHSRYSVEGAILPALPVTGCVVIAATLAACLMPAWRAGRTQPMTTLRAE